MKKVIPPTICILLCTLFIACVPTEADAAIYSDTVRLHILAASDSTEDQIVKLKVRDRILDKYATRLSAGTAYEVKDKLSQLLSEIQIDLNKYLCDTGYEKHVSLTLCDEWYDTRNYAGFSLPSGTYTSLKVSIGDGCGQNWWCVMYPPLCLDAAVSDNNISESISSYSKAEEYLISKSGYQVKFKLLEVASIVFDKKTRK